MHCTGLLTASWSISAEPHRRALRTRRWQCCQLSEDLLSPRDLTTMFMNAHLYRRFSETDLNKTYFIARKQGTEKLIS